MEKPRLSSVQVSPNAKNDLQNELASIIRDVPFHHIINLVKRKEYGLKKTWKAQKEPSSTTKKEDGKEGEEEDNS
ncbi:hypothetical protein SLA2020_181850 [Shorea laevis]